MVTTSRRDVLKAVSAGAVTSAIGLGSASERVSAASDCVSCGDGDADKVSELTFEYLGGSTSSTDTIRFYNGKDANDDDLLREVSLSTGGTFTVSTPSNKDELSSDTSIYVNGVKDAEFHTSCSQPVGPGIVKGSFEITDGADSNGDDLCAVDCGFCGDGGDAGDITQLTLTYAGSGSFAVYNDKEHKDEASLFEGTGSQTFTVDARDVGEDKLKSDISFYVDDSKVGDLHTSCSQPIYPGLSVDDFTIESGRTKSGRALCSPDDLDCALCGDDGDADGISQLTFSYDEDATVAVYNDKEQKADAELFSGSVVAGEEFTASASTVGEDKLKSDISLYANGSKVGDIHTSCSQPIYPGLTVGGFTVESGRTTSIRALCDPGDLPCATCGSGGDADDVTGARFEYLGDSTGTLTVYNDNEQKSDAVLGIIDLSTTTTITVAASTLDEDKLKSDISVYVDGEKNAEFHTSCSQPFGPGIQKGDVAIVDATTGMGQELCAIECQVCGDGDADGVSGLTLDYVGDRTSGTVAVYNDSEDKSDKLLGTIDLADTSTIQFSAPADDDELSSDISVYVAGEKNAEFHTSCSQPVGPGVQKGDFQITDGTSSAGADLCDLDCADCSDSGDADGVRSLELRYTGDSSVSVDVYNDQEAKADELLVEDASVDPNGTVQFSAPAGDDKLSSDISVYVDDEFDARFHTSCSETIGPGVVRGSFTVEGGRDSAGLTLCDVFGGDCKTCGGDGEAGDVRELTLEYTGDPSSLSDPTATVYNDQEAKDEETLLTVDLTSTTTLAVSASAVGEDKLSSDISVYVGGTKNTEIHTSCSEPLGPGIQKGDFMITGGEDADGAKLCPIECAVCGGDDDGAIKADDVSQLELGFLGNSPAQVAVYNDKDGDDPDKLLFEGTLDRGDVFTIMASMVGEEKLKSDISFFVDGSRETLHTSCSQPLGPGVRTSGGTFVVTGGQDEGGLDLCPQEVYCPPDQRLVARYTVENGDITFANEGARDLGLGTIADNVTFTNVQRVNGQVVGFEVDSGPYDLGSVSILTGDTIKRFSPEKTGYNTAPTADTPVRSEDRRGPETTVVPTQADPITEIHLCAPLFFQLDLWAGAVDPDVDPLPPLDSDGDPIITFAALGTNPEGSGGFVVRNPSFPNRPKSPRQGRGTPPSKLRVQDPSTTADDQFVVDFDNDTASITVTNVSGGSRFFTLGSTVVPGIFRADELSFQRYIDTDTVELADGEQMTLRVALPTP